MSKKKYIAPLLNVEWIEIEYCIAAGSANVTIGTSGNQYTPNIDEWNEGDYRSVDMDI